MSAKSDAIPIGAERVSKLIRHIHANQFKGKIMSQKLRITSDTILSISAIFIAFISIFISIGDGVETRKHNRLSVRPKLDMSYNLNQDNFGYVLTNNGLGPAIITDKKIFIDGHEINYAGFTGFDEFLDKLGLKGRLLSRGSLGAGTTIKSGSSEAIIVLKLFATDSTETLKKVYQRVSIELSYASMYEESFKCKIPSNEN